MDSVILGRSGIRSSVAGLGCGGASRLGLALGHSEKKAVRLVHAALDAGITLIDTAPAYGTERVVGAALASKRSAAVLSTKTAITEDGPKAASGPLVTGKAFAASIETSLRALGTSYLDILFLHGVSTKHYEAARDRFLPVLEELRDAGTIRAIGVTERFNEDPEHSMLNKAITDGCWDIVLVGFNFLKPGARERVFAGVASTGMATLCMHAVPRELSNRAFATRVYQHLKAIEEKEEIHGTSPAPVGSAKRIAPHAHIVDAAYRYCRHEPGVSAVLTGTGSEAHLISNSGSIMGPPLDLHTRSRLESLHFP